MGPSDARLLGPSPHQLWQGPHSSTTHCGKGCCNHTPAPLKRLAQSCSIGRQRKRKQAQQAACQLLLQAGQVVNVGKVALFFPVVSC